MLVLTLPVVFPTVMLELGYPIWFGVMVVIVLEGLISPPVGSECLYNVKGLDVSPEYHFRDLAVLAGHDGMSGKPWPRFHRIALSAGQDVLSTSA